MSREDSEKNSRFVGNVLKCRDDFEPFWFSAELEGDKWKFVANSYCSWVSKSESFSSEKMRSRIEPWLSALFQSEHLSLLTGSGLSQAVYQMTVDKVKNGMSAVEFAVLNNEINAAARISAAAMGRHAPNIEDQIRIAVKMLEGMRCYCPPSATFRGAKLMQDNMCKLNRSLLEILNRFAESILDGEKSIILSDDSKRERAFNYLVNFIMSFASRSGTRDRLHIFTTNYDRLIEAGAELAGLHLLDRFTGSLSPLFRSSRLDIDMHYNPPGIRGEPRFLEGVARFTKLHGSLDWVNSEGHIRRFGLPFGAGSITPYLKAPGLREADASRIMIYPNAAKDRETAEYPYVELFRDLAATICRPNHTLVTYGYGFGDEHINRVIKDMLTIPSTHLVIIAYDDPLGKIYDTYYSTGRHAQITLLVGNHLGNLELLVDHYLPKPAIDRTTFKMAELLKARHGAEESDNAKKSGGDKDEEGKGGEEQ